MSDDLQLRQEISQSPRSLEGMIADLDLQVQSIIKEFGIQSSLGDLLPLADQCRGTLSRLIDGLIVVDRTLQNVQIGRI